MSDSAAATLTDPAPKTDTAFVVIAAISFCHLLNDMMQSLLAALYPMLKASHGLDFGQIGLLTFTFQGLAAVLQPVVGFATDKRPQPHSLPVAMGATLCGLLLLAFADQYWLLLVAAGLVGLGSSIFHPESSRVARMASGGRHGLAQSLFQVGGNFGSALGPLLAAFVVLPRGQASVAWFSLAALVAMLVLWRVGGWYGRHMAHHARRAAKADHHQLPRRDVVVAIAVLVILVISKNVYMVSLSSYYTFFLIHKFDVSVQDAQLMLFLFLGAVAVGTVAGGPIGDRFGRKPVIWFSILGVLPFTLAMPHVGLLWTGVLSVIIGLVLASAFSAIVVFAQDLLPGRVGMVAGLFFGLAFGFAGIGAALLGQLADSQGIDFVYQLCAFLPALGLLAVFLPRMKQEVCA
ncbi:MAG: MFS transporter [Magnetospirillum sp.]|nr:MFS transporter [Magnetospirillum sp.]